MKETTLTRLRARLAEMNEEEIRKEAHAIAMVKYPYSYINRDMYEDGLYDGMQRMRVLLDALLEELGPKGGGRG